MLNRKDIPPVHPIDSIDIPNPEIIKLRNGISLYKINVGDEEVIRLDILIGGGQHSQDKTLQSMFTNRMLREGSLGRSSQQIAEKLDFYGAWLDLSSSVNYNFVTLYSLNKYFDQTLDVLSGIVKQPTFPENEFATVVDNNRQQYLVNCERVDMMTRKRLNESLFGKSHPLGKYAYLDDYCNINIEDLKEFYRKNYHSGNVTIFVSGKVTDDIVTKIDRAFGDEQWGEVKAATSFIDVEPMPCEEKHIFIRKENALQSSLRMGGFFLDREHPDFLKSRVLVTLFGGYFGSRLMSNIREDKGYTYGIGAGVISYPRRGVLAISTEAANEFIPYIITEVYSEMDRLCNDMVSDKELNMVKSYMIGDMCRAYEGPFSISDAWIYTFISSLSSDFYQKSLEAIKSVTKEEILVLAQKYFSKQNLIEVVAGEKM